MKKKNIKNKLAIFGKTFYWLIFGFLLIIATFTVLSAFNIIKGIKIYTVQSGSMEPVIHTGSIVISKNQDNYKKNDIITYKKEEDKFQKNPKYTITHRIQEVQEKHNNVFYTTKGDANDAPDSVLVNQDLVLGKTIFTIPYLGYPVSFAKTQIGLITLIIIPATLIIYSEILNIKNQIQLIKENKKKLKKKTKK